MPLNTYLNPVPFALAATLLAPATLHAQAGGRCDPASQDPASVNACAVQHFQAVDTAHHILYGDVMQSLSAHERPALRQDQNAWSRQRIRQCKAQHAADEARSDWMVLYHACLTAATEARRAGLLHWLHHGEAPAPP